MYILTGLSVHQSKTDSASDGIIMNGTNDDQITNSVKIFVTNATTVATIDGSTDKNVAQPQLQPQPHQQQQHHDENDDNKNGVLSTNSSIQQQQSNNDGK